LALALVCILSSSNVFQLVRHGDQEAGESLRAIEALTRLERTASAYEDSLRDGNPAAAIVANLRDQMAAFRGMAQRASQPMPAGHANLLAKLGALEKAMGSASEDLPRAAQAAAQGARDVLQWQWYRQGQIRDEMDASWRRIQMLVILSALLAAFPALLLRLYHRDLTDGRKAETALRESEDRLRRLVDVSPEAILVHREGKITFINEAGLTLLGAVSPQGVLGESILSFVHPDDQASVWQNWDNLRLTGESGKHADQRMVRLDKSVVNVEVIATPFADREQPAVQLIVRDVTSRRRAQAAEDESGRRLHDLVQNLTEGVFRLDAQGRVLEANAALAALLGYPEVSGLRGQPVLADAAEVERWRAEWPKRADVRQEPVGVLRRDGTVLEAWMNARRVASGESFVVEGTLTGEGGLRERERQLAAQAAELEALQQQLEERAGQMRAQSRELAAARDAALETSRLKSQFLASVSHEIRTPMNGLSGMLALLGSTQLSAEQGEYVSSARRSAEFLMALLNDILDFSKVGAGQLKIAPVDFSVRATVNDTLEILADRAAAKNLELASLIHPGVEDFVRADSLRVRQVLTNLLSNAVKYTSHGEVTVSVAAAPGSVNTLRWEVRDTGAGISESERRSLFEPFVQGGGAAVRHAGGTGLGLAIAKQLVEAMQGQIGVESVPGQGSCFWFTLPVEAAQTAPDEAGRRLMSEERWLAGRRVLLAVMNPARRRTLRAQLARWAMVTVEAQSGQELTALLRAAVAQEEPFHVVLLESELPDANAFRLAEEVAADAALEGTRLVLLSPFGRRSLAELSANLRRGFAALLPHPARPRELQAALAEACGWQLDARPEAVTGPDELAPVAAGARVLLAEDNAINQRVAGKLLRKLGFEVDLATTGREALSALAERPYSLVLMDCQMPDLDGFETTREIRRREGADRHVPVIAMTAYAMDGDRERCLAAGMDDYLSKPVAIGELRQAVERWANQRAPRPAQFVA